MRNFFLNRFFSSFSTFASFSTEKKFFVLLKFQIKCHNFFCCAHQFIPRYLVIRLQAVVKDSVMLLKKPDILSFFKFASLSTLSGITTYYLMNPLEKKLVNEKNLVVATGCDSGLGYSIAVHCHENLKMSVLACVHHKASKGAEKLRTLFDGSNRFHMVELEITRDDSINEVKNFIEELLNEKKDLGEKI